MTRPYAHYRHSGVEWLGEIPEHWNATRLGHIVSYRTSSVDKKTVEGELPIRLCNYTDVYYQDRIRATDGEFMKATASKREIVGFRLRKGDVVITKDSEDWRDIGVPALIEESAEDFVCGYHLGVIRPSALANPAFLFRLMQSEAMNRQLQVSASGVTRYGLPKSAVSETIAALPPLDEQRAIATFLDRETGKIDALLAKNRVLTERLEEYRTVLISRTVTRGLPPAAAHAAGINHESRLKPSGVEWVGEVPEHWQSDVVKHCYEIRLGKMLQPQPISPHDVETPYLKARHIQWGNVEQADQLPTMWAKERDLERFGVREGDLLVCEGGEGGRAALVDQAPKGLIIQNALHRVRPRPNSHNGFLQYWLVAFAATGWLEASNNKATIAHFTKEKFLALPFVRPPLGEQRAIVAFLDRETGRIDMLLSRVEVAIERLLEYRSALIAAAVTGKIDVRDSVGFDAGGDVG